MKSFIYSAISGFLIVTLSMGVMKSLGLASEHALSFFNIPYELAMGIIVISLPLGILTIAKGVFSCLTWFVRTWKGNGNK